MWYLAFTQISSEERNGYCGEKVKQSKFIILIVQKLSLPISLWGILSKERFRFFLAPSFSKFLSSSCILTVVTTVKTTDYSFPHSSILDFSFKQKHRTRTHRYSKPLMYDALFDSTSDIQRK